MNHDGLSKDLTELLGSNLRRLRTRRGLSLERLARESTVSRAMLSQIELGRSTPTIGVLWKISMALGVQFAALISSKGRSGVEVLRAQQSKLLVNRDGGFSSRALFPHDAPRRVEFYEVRLAAALVADAPAQLARPDASDAEPDGGLERSMRRCNGCSGSPSGGK